MRSTKWIILALTCAAPPAAAAQEGVDWGSIMAAEAHGSAMREAAREGSRPTRPARSRARARGSNARTRASCAQARRWKSDGLRDARLPRILSMCRQLGY